MAERAQDSRSGYLVQSSENVPGLIARGFEAAQVDSAHWQERAQVRISSAVLDAWADDVVTKRWGVLAAARTVHIAPTVASRTPGRGLLQVTGRL